MFRDSAFRDFSTISSRRYRILWLLSGVVIGSLETAFLIRCCESTDLPAVLVIEKASYPRPWSEQQFLQELETTYSRVDLLFSGSELAGYICYWLSEEISILNVTTSPDFRRKGVARRLLEHVFIQAKAIKAGLACLEVRIGNVGAITLYRTFGFRDDCIRRAYYSDGEDALLMSCALDSHEE